MRIEDMSDGRLLDRLVGCARVGHLAEFDLVKAELLRRLSAGNPQGEKVQITACECNGDVTVFAWLIERTDNGAYWDGRGKTFVLDNSTSVRFARKEDAERVIGWLLEGEAVEAREHGWFAVCSCRCIPCESGYHTKAERSDGRIEHGKVLPVESDIEERGAVGPLECVAGCGRKPSGSGSYPQMCEEHGKRLSGEQSETRIQGEKWPNYPHIDALVDEAFMDRGTSAERAESDVYDVAKRVIQHEVPQDGSKIKP